jgi:hypothetical protein
MTPDREILAFIERQPESIRDILYFAIVFGLTDKLVESWLDLSLGGLKGKAEGLLAPHGRLLMVYRALYAMASLDFLFSRPHDAFERAVECMSADEVASSNVKRALLQDPLRRKHFERAEAEWRALRQSSLTFEALHGFEETLIGPSLRSR